MNIEIINMNLKYNLIFCLVMGQCIRQAQSSRIWASALRGNPTTVQDSPWDSSSVVSSSFWTLSQEIASITEVGRICMLNDCDAKPTVLYGFVSNLIARQQTFKMDETQVRGIMIANESENDKKVTELPPTVIQVPCDRDAAISLVDNLPVDRCKIGMLHEVGLPQAGLPKGMHFDNTTGVLHVRADTRASATTLLLEVTTTLPTLKTYVRPVRIEVICKPRMGRRLATCKCSPAEANFVNTGSAAPSTTYILGSGDGSLLTGYQFKEVTSGQCTPDNSLLGGVSGVQKNGASASPSWLAAAIESNTAIKATYSTKSCLDSGSYSFKIDAQVLSCSTINTSLVQITATLSVVLPPSITATPASAFQPIYAFAIGASGSITFPAFTFSLTDCGQSGSIVITSSPALPGCITWNQTKINVSGCATGGTYTVTFTYDVTAPSPTPIDFVTSFDILIERIIPNETSPSVTFTLGSAALDFAKPTYKYQQTIGLVSSPTLTFSPNDGLLSYDGTKFSFYTTFSFGTKVYTVTATDPATSLTDSTFQITVDVLCTLTSVTSPVYQHNHAYTINSPPLSGQVGYTLVPTCAGTKPVPSVVEPTCQSLITFSGLNYSIYATDNTIAGHLSCTVHATFPGDPTFVISPDIKIEIDLSCMINSIAAVLPQNNTIYWMDGPNYTGPMLLPSSPSVTWSPSSCPVVPQLTYNLNPSQPWTTTDQTGTIFITVVPGQGVTTQYDTKQSQIVTFPTSPYVKYSPSLIQPIQLPFFVTLIECKYKEGSFTINDSYYWDQTYVYFIGEPKQSEPISSFVVFPINCFNVRSELLNNPAPTIIEDNAAIDETVRIFTNNSSDEGAYTLNLHAYVQKWTGLDAEGNNTWVDDPSIPGLLNATITYYICNPVYLTAAMQDVIVDLADYPAPAEFPYKYIDIQLGVGFNRNCFPQVISWLLNPPGWELFSYSYRYFSVNVTAINDENMLGIYPVDMQVQIRNCYTVCPNNGQLAQPASFSITLQCTTTAIPPVNPGRIVFPIAGKFYAPQTLSLVYTFFPALCVVFYELSLVVTQTNGNAPNVNAIFTTDKVSQVFIDTTKIADLGTYQVQVKATPLSSQPIAHPGQLLWTGTLFPDITFEVEIVQPCMVTNILPDPSSPLTGQKTFGRFLNDPQPTLVPVPPFLVQPSECTKPMMYRLYDVTAATYIYNVDVDGVSVPQTSWSGFEEFVSFPPSDMKLTQSAISWTGSRQYRIVAIIITTDAIIQGLSETEFAEGGTSWEFNVNFICTINSLTLSSPKLGYCTGIQNNPINTLLAWPTWVVDSPGCLTANSVTAPTLDIVNNDLSSPPNPNILSFITPQYAMTDSSQGLLNQNFGFKWTATLPTLPFLAFAPNYNPPLDFQIYVKKCSGSSIVPSSAGPDVFNYFIFPGNPVPMTYNLPTYSYSTPACTALLNYGLEIVRTDTDQTLLLTSITLTDFTVNTGDVTLIGTNNYKVIVTELDVCPFNAAPLISQTYTFKLNLMCAVSSASETFSLNSNYAVTYGTGIVSIELPEFTFFPAQCNALYTTTLIYTDAQSITAALPDFISVDVTQSPKVISINPGSTTAIPGVYNLEWRATPDALYGTYIYGLIFKLEVLCQITPTNPVYIDQTFTISGSFYAPKDIPVQNFSFSPAICVQTYTWTISVDPAPGNPFITQELATNMIHIDTTLPADVNVYTITVTATPEPKAQLTLLTPAVSSFLLNVIQTCFITTVTPSSSTVGPFYRNLQDPIFTVFTLPTFSYEPTDCSPVIIEYTLYEQTNVVQTIQFDEATNTLTQIYKNPSNGVINLLSRTELEMSQIGPYPIYRPGFHFDATIVNTMTVNESPSLTQPTVVNFDFYQVCTLQNLTLGGNVNYCHGALRPNGSTPLAFPSWIADPVCQFTPIFTLKKQDGNPLDANDLPFISGDSASGYSFVSTVSDFVTHNYQWYVEVPSTQILTGASGFTQNISIAVTGCFSTSMTPNPAGPGNFVYIINPSASTPQTYSLPTFDFTNEQCLNLYISTVTRTDPSQPVSFSVATDQLSFTYAGTSDTSQHGVQNYQMDAVQTNNCPSSPALTSSYTFTFTLQCVITSLDPSFAISTFVELIQTGTKTHSLPLFTPQPANCMGTNNYALVYKENGIVAAMPAFIFWSNTSPNVIAIDTSNPSALQGTYMLEFVATLTETASIIRDVALTPRTLPFSVIIQCQIAPSPPTIANVDYPINGSFHQVLTLAVPSFAFTPMTCVTSYTWSIYGALFVVPDTVANSIIINTSDSNDIGVYTIKVTATPQPAESLVLTAFAESTFTLNVYQPCYVTSITPPSSTAGPFNRYLNDANPTLIIIPTFVILPSDQWCQTAMLYRLYETTNGSTLEIATYDAAFASATQTDTYIKYTSVDTLTFTQNLNPQASTRSFKIVPEVISTMYVQGIVGTNPLTFSVNLICTLNALTLSGPPAYCHQALNPAYQATSIVVPTWTADPADCPLVNPVIILVQTADDAAPDSTLITGVAPSNYAIDTTDPTKYGTYAYSWLANVPTTAILVGKNTRFDFQISVCGCLSTTMLPSLAGPGSFTYVINPTTPTPQTFTLPSYLFSSSVCLNPYSITIVRTDTMQVFPFTVDSLTSISLVTQDTALAEVQNYRIDALQQNTCPGQTQLTNNAFTFTLTIQCVVTQVTPVTLMTTQVKNIYDPANKTVTLPYFAVTPSDCGATLSYLLRFKDANGLIQPSLPSFITWNPLAPFSFDINTMNALDVAFYDMEFVAKSIQTPTVIGIVESINPFQIDIDDACDQLWLYSPNPNPVEYTIGVSDPILIPFPNYSGCLLNPVLDYELVLSNKSPVPVLGEVSPYNINSGKVPTFALLDSVARTITIQGSDLTESWSIYQITVKATDPTSGFQNNDYVFTVTIKVDCVTDALLIPTKPLAEVIYEVESPKLVFEVPKITDTKSQPTIPSICGPIAYDLYQSDALFNVNLETLPSFVTFMKENQSINVFTTNPNNVGVYYFFFDIYYQQFKDTPGLRHLKENLKIEIVQKSTTSPFTIPIIPLDAKNSTETNSTSSDQPEEPAEQPEDPDSEDAKIKRLNLEDQQTIKDLQLTYEIFMLLGSAPKTKSGKRVELRFAVVTIEDINENGVLKLQVQERVNLMNEGRRIDDDRMRIELDKNSEQEELTFDGWDLLKYTDTVIEVQLHFNRPLLVSTGLVKDTIILHLSKFLFLPVYEPYLFVDIEQPRPSLNFSLQANLPMQISTKRQFNALQSVQKTVESASTAAMVIPFIAQVAAKGAMKKLWFYFNTVQLGSSYTDFILVQVPANVVMVKDAYSKIINVQLIPEQFMINMKASIGLPTGVKSQIRDELQAFEQTNSTEPSRRVLLYEPLYTREQIKKNRTFLGLAVGSIVAVIAALIVFRRKVWACLPQIIKENVLYVWNMTIWNGVIRSMLQIFYPSMLLSLQALAHAKENKTSIISPAIQVCVCIGFFLVSLVHIEQKKDDMDTKEYKDRYGAYVTNIETYRKPQAAHYATYFMLRRLVVAVSIVWLKQTNALQSLSAVHCSILMLSWLINVKPFDEPFKNYLEMVNEFLLCILGYFGFLFTGYVPEPESRYVFGYVYIGLLAVALLFNLFVLFYNNWQDLRKNWAYYKHYIRSCFRKKPKTDDKKAKQEKVVETAPVVVKRSVFLRMMEGESVSFENYQRESESLSYSSSNVSDYSLSYEEWFYAELAKRQAANNSKTENKMEKKISLDEANLHLDDRATASNKVYMKKNFPSVLEEDESNDESRVNKDGDMWPLPWYEQQKNMVPEWSQPQRNRDTPLMTQESKTVIRAVRCDPYLEKRTYQPSSVDNGPKVIRAVRCNPNQTSQSHKKRASTKDSGIIYAVRCTPPEVEEEEVKRPVDQKRLAHQLGYDLDDDEDAVMPHRHKMTNRVGVSIEQACKFHEVYSYPSRRADDSHSFKRNTGMPPAHYTVQRDVYFGGENDINSPALYNPPRGFGGDDYQGSGMRDYQEVNDYYSSLMRQVDNSSNGSRGIQESNFNPSAREPQQRGFKFRKHNQETAMRELEEVASIETDQDQEIIVTTKLKRRPNRHDFDPKVEYSRNYEFSRSGPMRLSGLQSPNSKDQRNQ